MRIHKLPLIATIALFLLTGCLLAQDVSRSGRLTPDDLFRLERVESTVISPDGNWVAFVRIRPRITATNNKQDFLWGYDRGDLWLAPAGGGTPINLTNGMSDGSGFWNPIWSPDSTRIALLSTRGGNVTPWILDRKSGGLRQLVNRGVDLTPGSIVWLSNAVVACSTLPEGEKPVALTVETQVADVATVEWPKAREGKVTTASVLDSGTSSSFEQRLKGSFMLIDVAKSDSPVTIPGKFSRLTASPDGHFVAAVETTARRTPKSQEATLSSYDETALAVFSSDGKRLSIKTAPGVLTVESVRWSPDSKKVALIGRSANLKQLYVYSVGANAGDPERVVMPAGTTDVGSFFWSRESELVIKASWTTIDGSKESKRDDWWTVAGAGTAINMTASIKSTPSSLIPTLSGDEVIGLSEGKLWRISLGGKSPSPFDLPIKIDSVEWFDKDPSSASPQRLVASSKEGSAKRFYLITLDSGRADEIVAPKREADFAGFDPHRSFALFKGVTREGSYLEMVDQKSKAQIVVETNSFLNSVLQGQPKKIDYKGMDGQSLTGWIILPVGYQAGKRYPIITWVYAGDMEGDEPSSYLTTLNSDTSLNLQLLSARDFMVLIPSMPLKPEGEASDPYMELTKGVMPAIDKAVELGYADPDRVGVLGQSFGGFSTYGLVTQTNRFKAAIALAGLSDFTSLYGGFDARYRYRPYPQEETTSYYYLMEQGQIRMGNPPWKDFERYVRNSPITYVDRVNTPLMIVQGDMDYVSINQGEEFFRALYRQGKRAQFVRYWGEGHVLASPANIRDFWNRAYAWFDEYLDVSRDDKADLVFDGDHVKSRNGAPPLKPEDFARFNEIELRSHPWVTKSGVDARKGQ